MFVFLISLLGILCCASCTEDACLYKAQQYCQWYKVFHNSFPGNEEELQNSCTNLNEIKECIKESVRNCSVEDVAHIADDYRLRQSIKGAQKLLNVTTEICQEDSDLHENFLLDMLCYREVLNTTDSKHCRDYSDNAIEFIRSRLNFKLQGREDDRRSFYECLNVLFDMNCVLEMFVEKCGIRAKDTAIKMIEIGGSLEDQCPVSIRIDILELLDALKLVTRKETYVRQLLETGSFF